MAYRTYFRSGWSFLFGIHIFLEKARSTSYLILISFSHCLINLFSKIPMMISVGKQVRYILMSLCALQSFKQLKFATTMMKLWAIGAYHTPTISAIVSLPIKGDPVILQGTEARWNIKRCRLIFLISPWRSPSTHEVVLRDILVILFNDRVLNLLSVVR